MSRLKERICRNKYVARYRADYEWRTLITTLFSSAVTGGIGTYNLVVAILNWETGIWVFTLAVYYLALALGRVAVLLSHRVGKARGESGERSEKRDAANYLGGGALLVFLTLAYSGILVLVNVQSRHYDYRGNMVYVMALYAFCKIIFSSVNAVRYRKYRDYTVQTLRNINFADGIVSIVALQTALLFTFTEAEELAFANTMNAAVGGVAGALILALGSYMIIRGYRELKREHSDSEEKEHEE